MVEVPVIQAFTHEGRAFAIGETIFVSPIEAAALHRRGLVSITRGYVAKAPRGRFTSFGEGVSVTLHGQKEVLSDDEGLAIARRVDAALRRAPDVSVDPPKRRTRRRDLESESTDEPTVTQRRYRRRDLTPES